jgi:hypothetical protein
MSFARDAFISYAHIDNEPLPNEKDGWVTIFDKALRQVLSRFTGKVASIWRDEKLQGNDIFSDEILSQFPETAVLVSVLSPRYLKSEWCSKEMTQFYEVAEKTGGIVIGNKCRIFKIIKTPFGKDESLPPEVAAVLGPMLGYEFYHLDSDNTPQELDPAYGDSARQDFLKTVTRVAWQIKELLEVMSSAPTTAKAKPAIYLAECTRDRRDARATLEAELKRLGYDIVPDSQLPTDSAEYVAEVERQLQRCELSIHLVGSSYGVVPDGTDQSVVALQNDAAVRISRKSGLARVISVPADLQTTDPRQQAFINALHQDAGLQFGADLITGGIEDLKCAVRDALARVERATSTPVATRDETMVYVICDPRDIQATVPLAKSLIARGIRVELTVFDGDAAAVREANEQLMTTASAIVLFWGAGDDTWRAYQQSDIRKNQGVRRDNPPKTITYVAGPATSKKQFLLQTEADVIDALSAPEEQAVAALAKALGLK